MKQQQDGRQAMTQLRPAGAIGQKNAVLDRALDAVQKLVPTGPLYGSLAALLLQDQHADTPVLVATLLSEEALAPNLDQKSIRTEFGAEIGRLVNSVRLMRAYRLTDTALVGEPRQAERLRGLQLALAEDLRAVPITLAYRVIALRLAGKPYDDNARRLARETLEIHAPLANRLGLAKMKWELEDLAFRIDQPEVHKSLSRQLESTREHRERYIAHFVRLLHDALAEEKITAQVSGRPKHLFSIWKKMRQKERALEDLRDILAVRVLVDEVSECYAALGVVHARWRHIPGEFDDYIANPKKNAYQSLHTAVLGPDGKAMEVQIRTQAMHAVAELGVAAHWRYKEGGPKLEKSDRLSRDILSLRQALKSDDGSLLDELRGDAFSDRVFVLTPRGEILELPQGATPLDFAYAVHTGLGHRCRGAKVDGHIVPLTHVLRNGERVEVLAAKKPQPSRDWMHPNYGFLTTSRARAKVRQWFKQQELGDKLGEGKILLQRELQRLAAGKLSHDEIAAQLHLKDANALYAALASGDAHTNQIARFVKIPAEQPHMLLEQRPAADAKGSGAIRVRGAGDLVTQFARCCRPAHGEPIRGYITKSRGVSVHRADCANLMRLAGLQPNRLLDVEWGASESRQAVEIRIEAYDRQGLLRDITSLISHEKINVLKADTHTDRSSQTAVMDLTVEVRDISELSRLLDRLSQVRQVYAVRRKRN